MASHIDNPGFVELFLTLATETSDRTHPARHWIARRYDQIVRDEMERLETSAANGRIRRMTTAEREFEARCMFAVMDGLELQWIADPTIDLVHLFDLHYEATVQSWRIPNE